MRPIGDLDLHLFGEGTHRRLWELLGPQPLHLGDLGRFVGARFAVWAPEAASVAVVGDWNGWVGEPMASVEVSGIWAAVVPLARTGHRYGFDITHVGGDVERIADPMARESDGLPGWVSIVPSSDCHEWSDDEWLRSRTMAVEVMPDLHRVDLKVLYEQGARSWDDVTAHLADRVVELGCTHIELSPVTQGPPTVSPRSSMCWAGRFTTAAQFGDPDGFRRLVDALHQRNVGVLVAWSLSRSKCLDEDLRRREVRSLLIANALYWLDEFHVDGLHVDDDRSLLSAPQAELSKATVAVVNEEFPDVLLVID